MMKRKIPGMVLTMGLIGALVFSLAACSKSTDSKTGGTAVITIRIMNEFKNLDKVLAQYRELTKDDPEMAKINPDFKWVTGGDYRDKLSMALVAQEDYDLMFCGSWHGLASYIQQGTFADLSKYFNNDEYPGLKKAFPPDFVEAMKTYVRLDDGSYLKGIFGINLAEYFDDTRGIMYREDLRKKYGCAPITDEQSLTAYLDTVIAGEKDQAGKEWLGLNMWNFFRMNSPFYSGKHDNVFSQDSTNVFGDQTHVYIGLSPDRKTVLNAVVAGDSPDAFAKMPQGYRYDFITEIATVRADKWNRFLSPIRGSGETELGEYLAGYSTLSELESRVKEALSKYPDAEYGFYVIEAAQRNLEKGAIICDMVTNNWLVVPEWSTKTDEVMHFLDWMFGTQQGHDLFQYGIEGEDWAAIGTDGYESLPLADNVKYVMPPYSLTLNPAYIRKSRFAASNADLDKRFDYMYDSSTYQLSPLAGFAFNPANVQTEIANVTALSNELQLIISKYSADEAVRMINQWHTEAARVGLEKVRAELINQVQMFLNAKNAN
ncbi:sugar ABC transporter substrate-binding protein [Spirochaetia bacterium]|nr:sugar ABC transporter substrate-binding protein [Spirochaetia bacterium]